jgi:response regulator RpfG family c-di-GMP phosphodiesterase
VISNNDKKTSRRTVMVCDDEADLLLMFEIELRLRYDVLTVDSGKKCIEKFVYEKRQGKTIDLLLLDYKLGDMLGDDVARKIKELNGVKIILISAYELDNNLVGDLKQNGYIIDVIKKPVDLECLSNKIAQNIGI